MHSLGAQNHIFGYHLSASLMASPWAPVHWMLSLHVTNNTSYHPTNTNSKLQHIVLFGNSLILISHHFYNGHKMEWIQFEIKCHVHLSLKWSILIFFNSIRYAINIEMHIYNDLKYMKSINKTLILVLIQVYFRKKIWYEHQGVWLYYQKCLAKQMSISLWQDITQTIHSFILSIQSTTERCNSIQLKFRHDKTRDINKLDAGLLKEWLIGSIV